MRKPLRLIAQLACALALSASVAAGQQLPVFSMEAVPPDNGGAVCGPKSRIVASPGDAFVVQIFVRDWSGTGHQLAAYQVQFEPSGYNTGSSGYVKPVNYNPEWSSQQDDPDNCFVDESHPLFIHKGMSNLALTDTVSNGYRLASIMMRPENAPASQQDGRKAYLGSVNFVVTEDASGTFTIGFIENTNNTGLRDERGVPIDPAEFESLTVVVKPRDQRERPTVSTLIERLNRKGSLAAEEIEQVDYNCDGTLSGGDLLALIDRVGDGEPASDASTSTP